MLQGREKITTAPESLHLLQVARAPFIKFLLKGTNVQKVCVSSRPDTFSSSKTLGPPPWTPYMKTGEDAEKLRKGGRKLPWFHKQSPHRPMCLEALGHSQRWFKEDSGGTKIRRLYPQDFEVLIQQSSQVYLSDHPLITGLCNRILIISLCIIIYQQLGVIRILSA